MKPFAPVRLLAFQLSVTLLCAASVFQSVLGLVRPDLVSEHRRLMNGAISSQSGVTIGDGTTPVLELYLESAVCLAAVALALAMIWRAGQRPEARMLALFLSCAFFPAMSVAWAGVPYPAVAVIHSAVMWVYVGAFLRFAALFPRPLALADLETADRVRAEKRGKTARPVGRARRMLLDPRATWAAIAAAGAVATISTAVRQPVWQALLVPFLVWSLVRGVGLLRASYAVADPVGQRRILWVVQGLYSMLWLGVIMLAAMAYGAVEGARAGAAGIPTSEIQLHPGVMVVANVSQSVSILLMVVCLAFATLFQGALDPRLALKRTTVYAMLAVSGALLFAVLENVASSFVVDVLHLSEGFGAALAGGVVALGFNPVREWLTRRVENRLGGVLQDAEPSAAEVAHA
jgi:hypothetical protein